MDDLKPYYKEIASLLRKAAERVRVAGNEKKNELPRVQRDLDSERGDYAKKKQNLEFRSLEYAGDNAPAAAIMAKQAKEMRDEEKHKEEEKKLVTEQMNREAAELDSLEKQLLAEADGYEKRTY